ncbi:DUF484 family protein [Zavarzinia sp. CC-PAN008]|uniref:DUF484 family protein n=1 Tax=Zavarzinia sp. CC-PAN008 TaxID=3243332 RepID=UPI003F744136
MAKRKSEAETPAEAGIDLPSREQVRAYLAQNPDFLADNPDLIALLTPPAFATGRNVLDMQQFMLQRVQGENVRLSTLQGEMLSAMRDNAAVQSRVGEAILLLLEARNFEHLVHVVTQDLATVLDVDTITLCVENDDRLRVKVPATGVMLLPPGTVEAELGPSDRVSLEAEVMGDPAIFGPAAALVRSQALVRLNISDQSPNGLLALGAREADKFQPGQGSDLLRFLADVIERLFRAWLDLRT